MGVLGLFDHLLNFVAPAAFVALALALGGRLVARPSAAPRWWVLALLLFLLGTAVLAAGLWWFGRDGKMATYAALVVVCATGHWALVRAWRR